jgi:hypothetical protein
MLDFKSSNSKYFINTKSNSPIKKFSQFDSSLKRNLNNSNALNRIGEEIVNNNKKVTKNMKFENSDIKGESIFLK